MIMIHNNPIVPNTTIDIQQKQEITFRKPGDLERRFVDAQPDPRGLLVELRSVRRRREFRRQRAVVRLARFVGSAYLLQGLR